MRLDRAFSDIKETIKRILLALDNNVTVQENFGPSGAPAGQTIVSRGPTRVPEWGSASVQLTTPEGSVVTGGGSVILVTGPPGPAGAAGPPGIDGTEFEGHYEPMAFDADTYYAADGDLVMGWLNP